MHRVEGWRMGETCLALCWGCSVHRWVWLGFFHTTSSFGVQRQQSYLTGLNDLKGLVQPRQFYDCMIEISLVSQCKEHIHLSLGLGSRRNKRTVQSGIDIKFGILSYSHVLFAAWDMTALSWEANKFSKVDFKGFCLFLCCLNISRFF